MKKLTFFLLSILLLSNLNMKAQDNGAAIAGAVAGIAAIGAGIAAVEQMKEQAELSATEWFLTHHPEFNQFSLKTLDFDGKKLKDMSTTSVITFKIQEFDIYNDEPLLGEKSVLFGFTSYGWINEYGIDFNKVQWFLINNEEWMNMMTAYSKVASGVENESIIRDALTNGKVLNRGIKGKKGQDVDFYKIDGDMYLVTDYSDDMKFIYNERSLGIYLKKTTDLVQIKRNSIIEIHEFFFDEN
ncbi:hypothetical protein [Maribacter aurantiacus]|uniref:Uncharacterized protein n=1 Tax=Maribacter aurantiacus TaxID=1882343 RepID=A0A5R8M5R1_9FLAO|nr:hypothetical protein [Maribacter aurantiacus]TLF44835.1 hypothetical protein FEK29_08705 [Maribacter aurantiacus]